MAKKKAKKVPVDRFGRTAASRIKTAETVAADAEQRLLALRREAQILRLQNGALMDVIRAHTERVDADLSRVILTNRAMMSHAKQHQAEGLLRALANETGSGPKL